MDQQPADMFHMSISPSFTDLPELILINIFNRLPLWKILQLASLHSRLNYIKQKVFRTQTQLRLLGGCRTSKNHLDGLKKLIQFFNADQNEDKFNFDLILEFDHSPNDNWYRQASQIKEMIKLSHDIHVNNLEQMADLAEMFPKLQKLTIAFNYFCKPQFLVQLLRNWPTLTHLYFVDFQSHYLDFFEYDNSIMAINNLHDLQVLAMFVPRSIDLHVRKWQLKILEPLLQNLTKLHTLYFPVDSCTKLSGRHIKFETHFPPLLNASLQIPLDRFEGFGLVDYRPNENQTNEQFTNMTTRLEISINREIRQLINWSALQYLSLSVDLNKNSLSHMLEILTNLHNLHEFILNDDSLFAFRMPLESRARQLPQLPSVRRFEFCSITSPYELYRFKWALPNVAELRLKLYCWYLLADLDDLKSFCTCIQTNYGDVLPEACVLDMKRAFCAYGSEIQDFYWIFYKNGRKGDGVTELVPLVERYTKKMAGMKRISFGLE